MLGRLHVDGIVLGRRGCHGRRARQWRGYRGLGERDSLSGGDLVRVDLASRVQGQGGERRRAWLVTVQPFSLCRRVGSLEVRERELFQQL